MSNSSPSIQQTALLKLRLTDAGFGIGVTRLSVNTPTAVIRNAILDDACNCMLSHNSFLFLVYRLGHLPCLTPVYTAWCMLSTTNSTTFHAKTPQKAGFGASDLTILVMLGLAVHERFIVAVHPNVRRFAVAFNVQNALPFKPFYIVIDRRLARNP